MTMTRKQFLRSILGAGVGAVGVATLAGCGGDDGGDPTPSDAAAAACSNPTNSIASNHGHTLTVPLADVMAGVERTYNIQGTSGHAHSLTITANQFTQIRNGQTLNLTSTSGGGHTHAVTVQCVS